MQKSEYPILEYDEDRNAFIRPSFIITPEDITERCVLCFLARQLKKS